MRWWRPAKPHNGQTLGVALLILSLVHTPLPQPDFHNIRHHDGPGEICERHDHLLRWHPGAAGARDVAVLHWHWFLPGESGGDAAPGHGPAVHAHTAPWDATASDDAPQLVSPASTSRLAARPAPCPLAPPLAVPGPSRLGAVPAWGGHPPTAFGATFAPGVSLTSLLGRRVC